MNVLLSGLIKRRMPDRAGLLIGIYLLSLSVGSIIGSLISVPVFQASGGSARLVLGLWAVPAALAAVIWLPQVWRRLKVTPLLTPPRATPPRWRRTPWHATVPRAAEPMPGTRCTGTCSDGRSQGSWACRA